MKFKTIEVTKEDIKAANDADKAFRERWYEQITGPIGSYVRAEQCPLALALRRQGFPNASVITTWWCPNQGEHDRFNLSRRALRFRKAADSRTGTLKPIKLKMRYA